jgi:hypothetical protein
MAISAVISLLILTKFLPSLSSTWSFCGQPTLKWKECKFSTECNYDNHCTQTQIVEDCNIGTDIHNAWGTHYTTQNYYTRIIMSVLFSPNLCLTMLIIFRNPILYWPAQRKTPTSVKETFGNASRTTKDDSRFCPRS